MDVPAADPRKLLDLWMEWERGEIPPGELMKRFKLGGLRTLLEQLAAVPTDDAGPTVGDLIDG